MAAVRVMAQRIARARRSGLAAAAQQYGRVIGTSEGDDAVLRVGTRAAGMEKAMAVVEEEQQQGARNWRRWSSGSWIAAGAASLSFAASTMTVAYGKERVTDRFSPKEVVLYQYDACPFCNKVKAFLDYHDIAYKVVEVNPVGKKEIKWSDYKKVPILVVDGEALNDSTAIITELTRRIQGGNAKDLAQKIGSDEEEKWRSWVDEHLVHLLSPNIYRTPREALQAFDYLTTNGNFSSIERATGKYVGATAMYFIGKRLKKRHNIIAAPSAGISVLSFVFYFGLVKKDVIDCDSSFHKGQCCFKEIEECWRCRNCDTRCVNLPGVSGHSSWFWNCGGCRGFVRPRFRVVGK